MCEKAQQQGTRQMAEHKQGSMDIREQEKTFAGFVKLSTWGAVISILVLIFLALANA
ncbi:aa3-type cytochrome c oxidase subunit IV [Paracoccaceae bacterium]